MSVNVGSILEVLPASYQDDIPFERSGIVTAFSNSTITLDSGASSVNNFYVNCFVFIEGTNGYDPKITAYNGTTKVATITGWGTQSPPTSQWSAGTPTIGGIWKLIKRYPVYRTFQWFRNGISLPNAIGTSYTPSEPGSYQYRESAHYINSDLSLSTATIQFSESIEVVGIRDTELVYQDNLTYLGCFTTPDYSGATANDNFAYGGSIAFNPNGNTGTGSLFVRGHVYQNRVGEISIPDQVLWATTSTQSIPKATLLGTRTYDPIEGQLGTAGITSGGSIYIGGLHVYQDRLLVTAHGDYTYNPASWFWSRPLDLTVTSQVKGPFSVSDRTKGQENERRFAGYMADIPTDLQTKLGGTVMCGLSAQSIVSATSDGPSISGFNPSNFSSLNARREIVNEASQTSITLDSGAAVQNNFYLNYRILCYDTINPFNTNSTGVGRITAYDGTTKVATVSGWNSAPTVGQTWLVIPPVSANAMAMYGTGELQNGIDFNYQGVFNWTGRRIAGAAIPNGTRSVMIFGKCGNGRYQYTISNISRGGFKYYSGYAGTDTPGEKAYPYYPRIWCYDANELEQARLGNVALKDVKPYAVINYQFPFAGGDEPIGVTYDKSTRRVFIATRGLSFGNMAIHVYSINNAVAV
jgi:hypothetical protein